MRHHFVDPKGGPILFPCLISFQLSYTGDGLGFMLCMFHLYFKNVPIVLFYNSLLYIYILYIIIVFSFITLTGNALMGDQTLRSADEFWSGTTGDAGGFSPPPLLFDTDFFLPEVSLQFAFLFLHSLYITPERVVG